MPTRACENWPVPSPSHLAAFVVASILFIQSPGPSLLFTIGRALTVGGRDALLSVVGNALDSKCANGSIHGDQGTQAV